MTVDEPFGKRAAGPLRKSGAQLPQQENAEGSTETDNPGSFSQIFGALKGTVEIPPGTDLTAPVDVEWEAER